MMSENEFLPVFDMLCKYYRFCQDDDEMLKIQATIYYERLKNHSADEFKSAVAYLLDNRTTQGMVKIAEIKNVLEGNEEERAINAFNVAIDAMAQIGSYASVRFEDEAIMIAIKAMGGWAAFGDIEVGCTPMAVAKRKEFIAIYGANKNRAFSGYLKGLAEISNGDDSEHNSYMIVDKKGAVRKALRQEVLPKISKAQENFNTLINGAVNRARICVSK